MIRIIESEKEQTTMTRKITEKKLKATAYHEAGHAAVAMFLGIDFKTATIVPDLEHGSLGHVLFARARKRLNTAIAKNLSMSDVMNLHPQFFSEKHRSLLERICIVAYAGLYAEHRFTGKRNFQGANSDFLSVNEMVSMLFGDHSETTRRYQDYLLAASEELVWLPGIWLNITILADLLLKRKTITREEAVTAIRSHKFEAVRHETSV
jgi:hypothetical protein